VVHGLTVALVFVAGLLLGVRVLAALYAPVDLWYTIGTAWPVALGRIVGWGGLTAAVLLTLRGEARWALAAGLGASLLLHVAAWALVDRAFPRRPGPTADSR
jgi:hypothetical protein